MSTFISKETISRLLKDIKNIMKNPLTENGIYYIHDDTDMLKGYALIIGSSETPYFGGNYFFEFNYPLDYPHSPPKVKYWTNGNNVRFNPNLYVCGKVCVSLLNTWRGDQWTSCQTISTVLLTLCTILCENPLFNEPGVTKGHTDIPSYNSIIEYSNLDIAVCDIVNKKEGVFMDFFNCFYPFVKENFIKNYDKLIEFAEKKLSDEFPQQTVLTTGYYSMKVCIDYNKVINKLKESRKLVDIM
uniref:Ubiquitin-conjugating enzyme E2 Z n=1 Tax=viral metagenome TaxID=1070528 RepID=A0A6C0ES16_9ZZZZ